MVYNPTAYLDKLTCTDYVKFSQTPRKIGTIFWSKNDSKYLDLKLKVFKKDDNKDFRLVQSLTMGETEFHQFMRLRNQLVIAAENFAGAENLSPVLIPTLSRDMDEQFKLGHNVVDVVDRAKRNICSNLLQYSVDRPKSSYAQVLLFAGKKEDEKFRLVLYVNRKL